MLLALGSGLVYGVSDYLGGRASRRWAPIVVTLTAELTLLTITLATVPVLESGGPTAEALWWGIGGGLAGSTGVLGLYLALSRGNMTVVAPITGVVAAVVPVVVGLGLGERPGILAGGGIVLALVAVLLIGGIIGASEVVPSTVALATAVGGAFGLLFVAYSRTGEDAGLWPLLTARFGATPLLVVAFLVMRHRDPSVGASRSVIVPGATIGVLVGLANGLYLLAARRGLLSVVAVLVALYPASTVALAALLDGEPRQPVTADRDVSRDRRRDADHDRCVIATAPLGSMQVSGFAGEAEHTFAEDVAHDVRRATHDRVAGCVEQSVDDVVPDGGLGPEHAGDELGDPPLVLRAEALGRRREPLRRLLEHLTCDEDAAEPVAGLERGDLLADQRVGGVGTFDGEFEQRPIADTRRSMPPRSCSSCVIVCLKALPSIPTRFVDRHPHVGEEHLARSAGSWSCP